MHLGRGMGRRASLVLATLGLGAACSGGQGDTSAEDSGVDSSGTDGTDTDESEPSCLDYDALDLPGYLIVGEWGGVGVSSVSMAGDLNGDGFVDVVTNEWQSLDSENVVAEFAVSFGKPDGDPIDLGEVVQGRGGFTVYGLEGGGIGPIGIFAFHSEAARLGDFDGDGLDDLGLISGGYDVETAAYVVLGSETPASLDVHDLEAGQGGVRIGGEAHDLTTSVAGPGDLNGDGLGEIMISTWGEGPDPARTYVVFGTQDPPPALGDVVAGTGGFVIEGASGEVDGAGDVNGDGVPDVMVGDLDGVTVVFGKADTETVYADDVRAGEGGFFIEPHYENGYIATAIGNEAPAGDINGDGFDDLLVDLDEYSGYSLRWPSGTGYVVFGKEDTEVVSLEDVDVGEGGFLVDWPRGAGLSSGIGDQNGDGLDDIAALAGGELLVMFGKTDTGPSRLPDIRITETPFGGDIAGRQDINGDGAPDFVVEAHPSCAVVVFGGELWDG